MDNTYRKLNNGKVGDTSVDEDVRGSTINMGDHESTVPGISSLSSPVEVKRLRLRAVETEKEFFFKLLNITSIRRLTWAQNVCSVTIIFCQVLLYAIVTPGYYKIVDATGIGIWAPLFFFAVASGLSYLAIKSPTGCLLGVAMAFQVVSVVMGSILVLLSSISLAQHGRYVYWGQDVSSKYDPEIPGRIVCSLMILSAIGIVFTSIFISIQFCRGTCCGRYKATESVLFDVETVKV